MTCGFQDFRFVSVLGFLHSNFHCSFPVSRRFDMWISRFSFRFCFGFLHSNFHCRIAVFQLCRSCAAVFVSVSLHARPGTELSRSRSTVSFRGVMLATVIRRGLQSNFSKPRNLPTRSFHSDFSRIVIITFRSKLCAPSQAQSGQRGWP